MAVPRVLALSLLIASCAAPIMAQSPASKYTFPTVSLFGAPEPLTPFRPHLPSFNPGASSGPHSLQIHRKYQLIDPAGTPLQADEFAPLRLRLADMKNKLTKLAGNQPPCYAMRSYQFKREDPASDTTRLSGYSTCTPGANIQMKDATIHLGPPLLK